MKINSINICNIYSPKMNKSLKTSPMFCSNDTFVKSTQNVPHIDELAERRKAIPEYLYHLTNTPAYENMIKTGQMNISKDIINGIFLFDMNDFQKNWRNTPNIYKRDSLAQSLVEQALKREKGLVLIKIPTKNLDAMKLVVRPQDEILDFIRSDRYRNLYTFYAERGGIFNYKELLPPNLTQGYSPTEAKKFIEQNRAIEYVYKKNIDLNKVDIEKAFENPNIDRRNVWGYSKYDFENLFKSFEENI